MKSSPPTLPLNYVPPVYEGELVQALRLIHHATAPTHKDGAYHENAFEIADGILKRVEQRAAYEVEEPKT